MKVLIFADSHSDVDTMIDIVNFESPDLIFHLGDQAKDAIALSEYFKVVPVKYVIGNTDSYEDGDAELVYKIGQHKIILTHGHQYGIDQQISGIPNLLAHGEETEASIILFGHSHQPFTYCLNRIWLFNPGRVGKKSSKTIHATYGLLNINTDSFEFIHREA